MIYETAIHKVTNYIYQLLAMVPQPVRAVVLLFPYREAFKKFREEENQLLKSGVLPSVDPNIIWMKQTVRVEYLLCGSVKLNDNQDIECLWYNRSPTRSTKCSSMYQKHCHFCLCGVLTRNLQSGTTILPDSALDKFVSIIRCTVFALSF